MSKKKNKTTFGTLAIAMFSLVLFSGVLLAVPFDVNAPYLSVSNIIISNPWASLIRNSHFWSSQFFLILSLIHIFDHFYFKERIGLKKGMAFRLSLGILIIFLAMLTGFLLKGDSDSQQARQILETLAQRIPIIGKSLAFSFLGRTDNFQLIYVHHIATLTIFIAIIMVEHSRKFWPKIEDFVLSILTVGALSYFFTAPLHDNFNPSVKGPWYFVGFQEILHWLSKPEWSLLLFIALIVLIFLINSGKNKVVLISKRTLFVFAGFYVILTLIGLFFRGERWKWFSPIADEYSYSVLHNFKTSRVNFSPEYKLEEAVNSPIIQGRKESCLACHSDTHGFTDSHKPEAIGCFSCHGGNPFAIAKGQAHRKLIQIPGNLESSKQTCGTTQCHPDIVERIPTGLMSTLSGMISVDRFIFGEQHDPDLLTSVHQLENSAADKHLKNLCVGCHLGNQKTEYGKVTESSRGGGCLACHLNYSLEAEKDMADSRTKIVKSHPSISLQVTNDHCFRCHSRSGRISTNYEGWHETTLLASEMPDSSIYRLIENDRVFIKEQEDVHHQLGMECIDCHHSYELMGDGKHYAHEEDQQDVQCIDCHFYGEPKIITADKLDNESALITALRFGNIENKKFLITGKHNHTLINTSVEPDSVYLTTKNSRKKMGMKQPVEVCNRNEAHKNVSCSACHSSWSPSCIGCHNTYDPVEPGYDMIKNKKIRGSWVEYIGTYTAKLPALGIRTIENREEVIPVAPGMVLTIDKKSFSKNENDSLVFHRLFAPVAPHTTAAKGRSCQSCHNNPEALGFGEGELTYKTVKGRGKWTFEPKYENDVHDNLSGDAWTGFLQNRTGVVSTRKNVIPFNIRQQQKVLIVGSCLTCHADDSKVMKESLFNFDGLIKKRSSKCVLPEWD